MVPLFLSCQEASSSLLSQDLFYDTVTPCVGLHHLKLSWLLHQCLHVWHKLTLRYLCSFSFFYCCVCHRNVINMPTRSPWVLWGEMAVFSHGLIRTLSDMEFLQGGWQEEIWRMSGASYQYICINIQLLWRMSGDYPEFSFYIFCCTHFLTNTVYTFNFMRWRLKLMREWQIIARLSGWPVDRKQK